MRQALSCGFCCLFFQLRGRKRGDRVEKEREKKRARRRSPPIRARSRQWRCGFFLSLSLFCARDTIHDFILQVTRRELPACSTCRSCTRERQERRNTEGPKEREMPNCFFFFFFSFSVSLPTVNFAPSDPILSLSLPYLRLHPRGVDTAPDDVSCRAGHGRIERRRVGLSARLRGRRTGRDGCRRSRRRAA